MTNKDHMSNPSTMSNKNTQPQIMPVPKSPSMLPGIGWLDWLKVNDHIASVLAVGTYFPIGKLVGYEPNPAVDASPANIVIASSCFSNNEGLIRLSFVEYHLFERSSSGGVFELQIKCVASKHCSKIPADAPVIIRFNGVNQSRMTE